MLERFAHGDLGDEELSAVLAHLGSCSSCAQAGRESVRRDAAALRAEFTATPPAVSSRAVVWSLAAAAVIALVILAVVLYPRQRTPSPSARPPVVREEAPPRETPRSQTTTEVAASEMNPEWQRLVAGAQETGRLPVSTDLAALQRSEDVVRGATDDAERVSPAAVILDDVRPTFTWPSRPAGTYVVFVFDEHQREVMRSEPLHATRWAPESDLPRGRTLTWQVEVPRGDSIETIPSPPSPPAMFRIVSERHHEELARALELHPGDSLLHAVLYARSGMRAEAMASLRLAARTDPAAKRILDHETSSSQ